MKEEVLLVFNHVDSDRVAEHWLKDYHQPMQRVIPSLEGAQRVARKLPLCFYPAIMLPCKHGGFCQNSGYVSYRPCERDGYCTSPSVRP